MAVNGKKNGNVNGKSKLTPKRKLDKTSNPDSTSGGQSPSPQTAHAGRERTADGWHLPNGDWAPGNPFRFASGYDPRRNYMGAPSTHDELEKLIHDVGSEVGVNNETGEVVSRVYNLVTRMYESRESRDRGNLLDHGWGKAKGSLELSGPGGGPLEVSVLTLSPEERAKRIRELLIRAEARKNGQEIAAAQANEAGRLGKGEATPEENVGRTGLAEIPSVEGSDGQSQNEEDSRSRQAIPDANSDQGDEVRGPGGTDSDASIRNGDSGEASGETNLAPPSEPVGPIVSADSLVQRGDINIVSIVTNDDTNRELK